MAERTLIEQLDAAIDLMLAGGSPEEFVDPTLSALLGIASSLREMPDDEFKVRLGRELQAEFQRRPPMTTSTHSASSESGAARVTIHSIAPFIFVPDGDELIEFMKQTFDAEETTRHPHGQDGFVASMRIDDSDLLIMAGQSLRGQERPAALHVYVKDCDAIYQRALDAGAFPLGSPGVGEPADRPYGERAAFVEDPFGNYWFIATRHGSNYVGEGLGHVTPCLLPSKAAPLIGFLQRAFGATVEGPHEQGGRLVHAFVRIGGAMMEIAEPEQSRQFAFYMHTDDVDALYHRALAEGATSILAPADQLYGDRLAIMEDPAGNRWFAAKRIVG